MEKDKKKHQDEIVELYDEEGKRIRDEKMMKIRKYMATQIERLKGEKSQEFEMLKNKQDKIIEKQKILGNSLSKIRELTRAALKRTLLHTLAVKF